MKIIESKKAKGLCCAYRCKRKAKPKSLFCSKHSHIRHKETNPVGYTYMALKSNAKRRGKEFKLTLDEFRQFCEETDYIEKKGKYKKAATIDRINPDKGYEIGNIQVLTLSENASKGTKYEDAPF